MTIKHDVELQIARIIKADTAFDGLQKIKVGVQLHVPLDDYPFCEIIITDSDELDQETGIVIHQFVGVIRFETWAEDDVTEIEPRIEEIASYVLVDQFVSNAISLFRKTINHNLNAFKEAGGSPTWAVNKFLIEGASIFGLGQRDERTDTFQNRGSVPFVCEVREVKS